MYEYKSVKLDELLLSLKDTIKFVVIHLKHQYQNYTRSMHGIFNYTVKNAVQASALVYRSLHQNKCVTLTIFNKWIITNHS